MRRKHLNRRKAISSVLATVFFVGIAIAVALTLFIMSSTYNNLYQQQLAVREERLRETIVLTGGRVYNVSGTCKVMNLAVSNPSSETAHIVSAYLNDELVNNSISLWLAPATSGWTGNTTLTDKVVNIGDRVTVSTDRGTTSTAIVQWSWFVGINYSGKITPYQFQIIALNPTPPEKKGQTQFTLFQRQYFYYVIDKRLLNPAEYGVPSKPPARFEDKPNATSYDPQGSVGVRAGVEYAIWMEEFQLEPSQAGGGGSYRIKSIRWAHYNTSITPTAQVHPVLLTIPITWPTWTYTVGVMLAPSEYVSNATEWTIDLSGPLDRDVGQDGLYGGYISFSGGANFENLINVDLTLVTNATSKDYTITTKFPAGPGSKNVIHFDLLLNGISRETYYWVVTWDRPGTYTLQVTAKGYGQLNPKNEYTGTSNTIIVTVTKP